MTVKRMIEDLKRLDPDAQVKLHHFNGNNALFVVALANEPKTVWIEGNEDVDLTGQLNSLVETEIEDDWEERDFYSELVEKGITYDDILKALGQERADVFKMNCENYGLI